MSYSVCWYVSLCGATLQQLGAATGRWLPRISRMWLIPKDAEKPTDGRYKKRGDRVDKNSNM